MYLFNSLEYILLTSKTVSVRMLGCWLADTEPYYTSCQAHYASIFGSLPVLFSPCLSNSTQEKIIFILFYEKVKKLIDYHKFDDYAKNELAAYGFIQDDKSAVKDWLIKNEIYAKGEYPTEFSTESPPVKLYKEYTQNWSYADKRIPLTSLLIKIASFAYAGTNFHILIKRTEFNNVYAFNKLFHDLYYVQKLYPEDIEKDRLENEDAQLSPEEMEAEVKQAFKERLQFKKISMREEREWKEKEKLKHSSLKDD